MVLFLSEIFEDVRFVFQEKVGEGFYLVLVSYKQYFFDLHFNAQKKFLKDTEVSKFLRSYLGQFQKTFPSDNRLGKTHKVVSSGGVLPIELNGLHERDSAEIDLWSIFFKENDLSFEKARLFRSALFAVFGSPFTVLAQNFLVFCKKGFGGRKDHSSVWFLVRWGVYVRNIFMFFIKGLIRETVPLLKGFWVFLKNHLKAKHFDNIVLFWANNFRPAFFLIFEWISRRIYPLYFLSVIIRIPFKFFQLVIKVGLGLIHVSLLFFVLFKLFILRSLRRFWNFLIDFVFLVLYVCRLGPFTDFLYLTWNFIFLDTLKAFFYCFFWLYYLFFFGFFLGMIDSIFGNFFQRLPKKLWLDNSILFFLFGERVYLRLFPNNFVHTSLFRKVSFIVPPRLCF